ncbi:MAG TPA: EAL domain-containing protein [Steroidobacter sp.]|uniref:putative bifunctional diguanylate cyclase/phosphodiesterase n=1 Tax=Steroidobacter sp. TaxID=1978227 RepID=UPI002ED777ED
MSVAALAAAANFIVERGVSFVADITMVTPPASLPAVDKATPLTGTPATTAPPAKTLSADELTRALERFDEAVYSALQSDSIEVQARYRQSIIELDRAAESFMIQTEAFGQHTYMSVPAALRQHKGDAARWIDLSQDRRRLLREYSETLEHMDGRVNASLDGAFKIWGRVVARQSLVQLNTSLSGLRDSFAGAVRTWSTKPEIFQSLTTAEAAFAKSLLDNARSLRRAESDEWFSAMERDFARLVEVRTALVETHQQLTSIGNGFVTQTIRLLARMPKSVAPAEPATGVTNEPHEARPQQADGGAPPIGEHSLVTKPLASPSLSETNAAAEPAEPTSSNRTLVAWISVIVLAVLLWISIATVRSVVIPVRRLIAASEKIAAGEPDTRVARGGIKELDSLAVAFNNMAERLSRAQAVALDAHHHLEEKVAERTRQLQELAEVDPLTGLPNRRHLFTLLNASIDRASRDGRRVGVLFLDVDNFKNINDSIGHSFGDRVLRAIAQRLQAAAQPAGFAARLGGDEFTIIYEGIGGPDDVHAAGEQIIRAFQSPLDIDGRDLIVGVSVGASIYPEHEQNAEALLIAADTALFHTKSLGRGRVSVFTPDLLKGASNQFRIEQDLRRAIERDEFELFFQPEVGIDDLQTQLVEALLRWRTPDGRYVPPGEFLSVAEQSGLIIEISDWVLRTAVRAASQWHHGSWPQARVAVNVSPRQLLDYRFVDRVRELLAEYDLPARCIEIELTESVLQTGPATIEQLHRLRALGLAIALDDFGTGYSSLSSLERLPLTRVKLDRSLIESIDTNTRSRSIVRAIVEMCNGLGLQVTAEGLERAEQFERLLGCKHLSLQGYLLARPAPMEQVFTAMASAAQRAQELVLLSKTNAVASVIKQLPVAAGRASANK